MDLYMQFAHFGKSRRKEEAFALFASSADGKLNDLLDNNR